MAHCLDSTPGRALLRIALALALLAAVAPQAPSALAQSVAAPPGIEILETTATHIEFAWAPPEHTLSRDEALGCDALSVAGLASMDTSGWPALPAAGGMFGLPHDAADIGLEILEADYFDLPGVHALCPAPRPIWEQSEEGAPVYLGQAWDRDPRAYALDSYWPAEPAALAEDGNLRAQRFAQVALYPFQYRPAAGQLRGIRRLRARLTWASGPTALAAAAEEGPDPFDPLYLAALVNHEQARAWRQPQGDVVAASLAPLVEPPQALYITTRERGLVRLTGVDLAAAGVPIAEVDPGTIRVFNQGQEVARRIVQQDSGPLQPADLLLFYSESFVSQYTRINAYRLTWGGDPGVAMSAADGALIGGAVISPFFAETHVARQERVYLSTNPMPPDQNRWYWGLVLDPNQLFTRIFTSTVPSPAVAPAQVSLRVYLTGLRTSMPQHSARVLLNGHLIGEAYWPQGQNQIFDVAIPSSVLLEGVNSLSVTAGLGLTPGHSDLVYLHRFEIDYARRYVAQNDQLFFGVDQPGDWLVRVEGFSGSTAPDLYNITDPLRPVRITGAAFEPGANGYTLSFGQSIAAPQRYLALTPDRYQSPVAMELVTPSNWRDSANGADYIIVTHGDFYQAIQPLATVRRNQGLRVAVVDVQDIYNEFNHGIVDAEAIRSFISHAYHNWTRPAPAYVLLVGDGNFDPNNYMGRGEVSYIPPYLADVDPWLGETAADNRYVAVHGDDIFPDLFLGRLPVKTAAETTAMVDKIIAYEALAPADWQRRITFLADDPDAAGNFPALSEVIASQFTPAPYVAERIYYVHHPDPTLRAATITATRTAFLDAFNQGRLIINWRGHSSVSAWASEGFLTLPLVNGLNNGARQPLMVPMTCLEGYYISPSAAGGTDMSSISEALVRLPGRGAIASFAPTGLGVSTGHAFLNRGLFEALFFHGVAQLGPATTLAKLELYSGTGRFRELIDAYLLMGDPAMRLKVLETDLAIEKSVSPTGRLVTGDIITYTLTYTNAGPATAHNVVITDTLPAALENPTVTSSGATITPRPGTRFVWDVADLPPGGGGVITITATIGQNHGGSLQNTAHISTTGIDSNVANNQSQVATQVFFYRIFMPLIRR